MTVPHYDETISEPLTSDALIEKRVASLIGRASRRQLWFLFLDENDVQLPLVIPIADMPARPDGAVTNLVGVLEDAMAGQGAQSVILVIERYADSTFTDGDKAWARAMSEAFESSGIPLRCVLVSHRRGVRWFAEDDYRFSA